MTATIAQTTVEHRITSIPRTRLDPDRLADFRRRIDRDAAELLLARAEWARPEERGLIVAVYRDGVSLRDLGTMSGRSPKTIREVIRRAVARMVTDRFAFVLREHHQWGPLRRRIATECVLHGHSMRHAARTLGVSLHTVRRHMELINAMESAQGAERAA